MIFWRYSLKKLLSVSVTFPGRVPLTPPVVDELPSVPFVENAEIVVVFDGGPPSIKSNASWALVPDREEVSRLTSYDNAKALLASKSKKLIVLIVHAVVICKHLGMTGFLSIAYCAS